MQLLRCAIMYIYCVSQAQVEVLRMQDIYCTHMHFENPHSHSQSLKAVSRSHQEYTPVWSTYIHQNYTHHVDGKVL